MYIHIYTIYSLFKLPRHLIPLIRSKSNISRRPRKRTEPERTSHPATFPAHWWPRTPWCWGRAWVRCSGQWRQSAWWWWLQVQTSKRCLHQDLPPMPGQEEHWNVITEVSNQSWPVLSRLYLHIPVVPPGVADGHPGPGTDHVGGGLGWLVRQGGGETETNDEELSEHGCCWLSELRRTMVTSPPAWYLCNQRRWRWWWWWSVIISRI